jgi:O-antigen ligase
MSSQAINKPLGTFVLMATISVTLFVSPWNSIDPVNLPKLTVLGVLAFITAALGMSNTSFLRAHKSRPLMALLAFFVLQLFSAFLIGENDFSFKLYGTPSRNTGFLAYLSLTLLLFGSAVAASKQLLNKFVYALIGIGGILGAYGLAQSRGFDFWNYANGYESNVFGTFGNPNFQSAFMGITAAVAMTWVLLSTLEIKYKLGLLVIAGLAIANVYLSSEQGYLNFIAGLSGALLIYLFSKRRYVFAYFFMVIAGLGTLFLLLGILNNGPLATVIYKSSLQARGFYWRAAINMSLDHPLFGVGPDGFGDWYRRSRTQSAAEFNPGIVADTAHSVPLDIAVSGGIPLLILYLAIIGLATLSIFRVIKRASNFDPVFASIVAAWIAFQAQSVISINQIGLGVWGWSLTGLLIGYEVNTRNSLIQVESRQPKKSNQVKEKISSITLVISFIAGGIGLSISLPPYLAANKFYKALQSADGILIKQGAYLMPYDRARFIYTVQILASNKLDAQAIEVLQDALKIYPDNFELWQQFTRIPSATPQQVMMAKDEMQRLDPFNLELK